MRILHVNDHLASVGGIETYLLSLMPRLERLGHQQMFVFGKGNPSLADRAAQVLELSQGGKRHEDAGRRALSRILADFRPDVVHLHNIYNVGAIDACLNSAPTVVTGHDFRYVCPASSMFYKRTERICTRRCGPACFGVTLRQKCLTIRPRYAIAYYRRVRWMASNWGRFAGLITPSHAAMERFVQAGFPREQSSVLPYFCPLEPLAAPRPNPEQPTILFLGRITAIKGFRYFVQALGRLPANVRGVMIGDFSDENRRRVKSLSADSGCADRLELRPWAERNVIQATMCAASVVCFPSICPETLGIVGLESLACGVPVVASDVGGVREWLIPEVTGLLSPAKDAAAMADGIRTLLTSPELNQRMGRAGLELIREKFSPERHVAGLMDIYRRATGQKPTMDAFRDTLSERISSAADTQAGLQSRTKAQA
ncbi:MAG: glycosyltransferase family 4 protein [Planctomycetaceae bacterium]